MKQKHDEMRKDAINAIIDCLNNGYDGYCCDLHDEVFNTEWYIVGTEDAKNALREYDVFDAIEKVMNYEKEQFGEVNTDIANSEMLVNMLFYIIGDEVISDLYSICLAFDDCWNDRIDDDVKAEVLKALSEMK